MIINQFCFWLAGVLLSLSSSQMLGMGDFEANDQWPSNRYHNGALYDGGQPLQPATTVDALVQGILPGSVVILGESHGLSAHRDQHLMVLQALRERGLKVSVGLEFLNHNNQEIIDQFRRKELSEAQFLTAVQWNGFSFDFYRDQLLFPRGEFREQGIGLNVSRSITNKISRLGLTSLTAEERQLLPADFTLGRDSYRKRFQEAAGAHCRNFDNCFAAQSAWDDTMAWQAGSFIQSNPDQVLVIVVGEFHAQYGGGLPDRLRHRYPGMPVVVISQLWIDGLTDEEVAEQMKPSVDEGSRADYIWVSR